MDNLNRRTMIAGTTALAALTPLALAASEADEKVSRLYAAYVEAEARDDLAYAALDDAETEARLAAPVPLELWPAEVVTDGELRVSRPAHPTLAMDRGAIEVLVAQLPEGQREKERRVRLQVLKEWEAKCSRLREVYPLGDLGQASVTASTMRDEAWAALMDTAATSVVGIALKLAAALRNDPTAQMVWTGQKSPWEYQMTAMLLSVHADAMRLAGLPQTFGIDLQPCDKGEKGLSDWA